MSALSDGPTSASSGSGDNVHRDVSACHIPVLYQEALDFLRVRPGGVYIDGTVGAGGHAAGILQAAAPDGRLMGLDRDPAALLIAAERLAPFGERAVLRHGSFARLVMLAEGFAPADGILLDLGLSSMQLADPARGFAFAHEGPLDMRFDSGADEPTAAEWVNTLSVQELTRLLYRLGEEPQARRIAEAIVAARPLHMTVELVRVIEQATGARRERIHPATLTFQALRIAVNQELEALEAVLPQLLDVLRPGGRLVVISFHSLEDRRVKQFLRREAQDCICPPEIPVCACGHRARLCILTRRPVQPGAAEVAANPRARSARLRAAEKI